MSENFEPQQLKQHDTGRLKGYQELLDFYNGRHWEGHPRYGETRLTFNYAKVIIDKVTSYLMSEITFNIDAAADSETARASARQAELALQQAYAENNLRQLDYETEIDCAIMGDGCFKSHLGQRRQTGTGERPRRPGHLRLVVGRRHLTAVASRLLLSPRRRGGSRHVRHQAHPQNGPRRRGVDGP